MPAQDDSLFSEHLIDIDSWDKEIREAFLSGLGVDPPQYGTEPVKEIANQVTLLTNYIQLFEVVNTTSEVGMTRISGALVRELRASVYVKKLFVSWDKEAFKKYFSNDRYEQAYRAGHMKVALALKERMPVLREISSVNYRSLETLGDIASAMMTGVRETRGDLRNRAAVRARAIRLLVDNWKGTTEAGVQVIENEIRYFHSEFPTAKHLVQEESLFKSLLYSFDSEGAQVVKYWERDFLSPSTPNDKLITLIKTSLVPKIRQLGLARLGGGRAQSAEIHAEYSRIMKENSCHDDFYAISQQPDTKAMLAHKLSERDPDLDEKRTMGDKAMKMVINLAKEPGTCWNCLQKDHATRDCPRLVDPDTNLAALIMPDYKEVTKRDRPEYQERMALFWNKPIQ